MRSRQQWHTSVAAQGRINKAEDSRKCILHLQVHFAVWCPGPGGVKEAAPCSNNGAAWPKAPPKQWSACGLIPSPPLGSTEQILEKKASSHSANASLQGESVLQPLVGPMQRLSAPGSRKMGFSPKLSAFREFPALGKTVRPGDRPRLTKGTTSLGWWLSLLQKEFCCSKSRQRDLKCVLMGKKSH